MEKLKRNKGAEGITLIALVTTVVVLLILAGVALNLVIGNNGIIKRTQEAKKATSVSEIEDKAELAKASINTTNLVSNKQTTREDVIKSISEELDIPSENIQGNVLTTKDGKYDIMVKIDNKIEVVPKGEGYIDAEYKEHSPETEFEYEIDEETDTVIITKYTGTDTVVNIPETIAGKTVTEIGTRNQGLFLNKIVFPNKNVKSIKIPDTVKTIGVGALKDNKLTYIDIPKSVTKIGNGAFNNNLLSEEQAYIYQRTSTGEEDRTNLVSYGGNKTDIIIPETVNTIERCAFFSTQIEKIIIGNNVNKIGVMAFALCNNLKEVEIGKNVLSIDGWAFALSTNLTNVEFKGNAPSFNYNSTGSATIYAIGGVFSYNANLRIKVPEGKLEDYKSVKAILDGEEYKSAAKVWFDEGEDYMLEAFYE